MALAVPVRENRGILRCLLCHGIFTDRSSFRLLFPRNMSVPVYSARARIGKEKMAAPSRHVRIILPTKWRRQIKLSPCWWLITEVSKLEIALFIQSYFYFVQTAWREYGRRGGAPVAVDFTIQLRSLKYYIFKFTQFNIHLPNMHIFWCPTASQSITVRRILRWTNLIKYL